MRRFERKQQSEPPDADIGVDPYRDAPRKASRGALTARLNRLAVALNFGLEELSEIRHDLHVAESFNEPRPSLPIRYMEPGERER